MGYRTVSRQLFGTLPDSGMPARLDPELTENPTFQENAFWPLLHEWRTDAFAGGIPMKTVGCKIVF